MKVTVDRDFLIRALKIVGAAVPARTSLPILTHVHIEAREPDTLILDACDLEWAIRVGVKAHVEEGGETALPHRHLSSVVGTFPGGMLVLDGKIPAESPPNHGPTEIEISQDSRSASLRAMDPQEYPVYDSALGDGAKGYLVPDELATLIHSSAYAAATDESRPVLTGVFFRADAESGSIFFGAADGFRAVMVQRTIADLDLTGQAIIKATHMVALAKYLEHEVHPVEIQVGDSKVRFSMAGGAGQHAGLSGIEVVTQLIEGNYVNIRQIANTNCQCWISFDREELLAACRAVEVIACLEANAVRFRFTKDRTWLLALAVETGEMSVPVPCQVEGGIPDPNELSLNAAFAIDALSAVPTDVVVVGFAHPARPVLLLDQGRSEYQAIIMPMHTR